MTHRRDERARERDHGETTTSRLEQAKDVALGSHRRPATLADRAGEAVGGVGGALIGGGIGSFAGPAGTVVGVVAGAFGGWWTGRAIVEAAERISLDDESYYRKHYEADRPRAHEVETDTEQRF